MMLFKPEHVPMILSGKKTATRRNWIRPLAKVGNIYKCKTKMFDKKYFAKIKVTRIFRQSLGDMQNSDYIKEGYDNKKQFVAIWNKINGDWDPYLIVTVIEFDVVCPEDADMDPDEEPKCRALLSVGKYLCTRRKGHEGEHHAHGDAGTCFKKWI